VRIFIEGPWWSGEWTAICAATLEQLGHEVAYHYHNRRTLADRFALAADKLAHPAQTRNDAWTRRYQQRLAQAMHGHRWDLLFSIQGKVQTDTLQRLRRSSPGLKVVYWWGDIYTDLARRRIAEAAEFSHRLLVSYRGVFDKLVPVHGDKVCYFPFGASPSFHRPGVISPRDRQRYAADVAFVGTCYPERCDLVRYLNARLGKPVRVWGRGWRHCRGVRTQGPLSLADSLKVYACSAIALNLHHRDTDNGCNMKFYEIPAAGGFQICDRQAVMEETALGTSTITCRSPEDFADNISRYLACPQERQRIGEQATALVYARESYLARFGKLMENLDL
jgi:spore maturation protein CgeB